MSDNEAQNRSATSATSRDADKRDWFASGWHAALKEVELRLDAGHGLYGFLAEQRNQSPSTRVVKDAVGGQR